VIKNIPRLLRPKKWNVAPVSAGNETFPAIKIWETKGGRWENDKEKDHDRAFRPKITVKDRSLNARIRL
jgi:hypothetical protein